MESKAKNVKQ